MIEKTLGFIGGGRITRILLEGFRRAGVRFPKVFVSDTNPETLQRLKERFSNIEIFANDNRTPTSAELVFLALHPPAVPDVLKDIRGSLRADSILISLAPKITMAKISEILAGFMRIVRMIPNACSIINHGYNPVAFSSMLDESEKKHLMKILSILGDCPEVDEAKLEVYAIVAAMGPTYLWFQLYELEKIGMSFGLTAQEVRSAVSRMVEGAALTMSESELVSDEVMDLIPIRPLGEEEETIKRLYRSKLEGLYNKLKS